MMNQKPLPTDQSKPFHSGADHHSPDYSPYPKLDPNDVVPPSQSHPSPATAAMPAESNPYVSSSPSRPPSSKNVMDSVRDALGKWGNRAADATKKAENLAGNMWQHLKTSPNVADVAVARMLKEQKFLLRVDRRRCLVKLLQRSNFRSLMHVISLHQLVQSWELCTCQP